MCVITSTEAMAILDRENHEESYSNPKIKRKKRKYTRTASGPTKYTGWTDKRKDCFINLFCHVAEHPKTWQRGNMSYPPEKNVQSEREGMIERKNVQ